MTKLINCQSPGSDIFQITYFDCHQNNSLGFRTWPEPKRYFLYEKDKK